MHCEAPNINNRAGCKAYRALKSSYIARWSSSTKTGSAEFNVGVARSGRDEVFPLFLLTSDPVALSLSMTSSAACSYQCIERNNPRWHVQLSWLAGA